MVYLFYCTRKGEYHQGKDLECGECELIKYDICPMFHSNYKGRIRVARVKG